MFGGVDCLRNLSDPLLETELGALERRLVHSHLPEFTGVWRAQLLETPKQVLLIPLSCVFTFRRPWKFKICKLADSIMNFLMSALVLVGYVVDRERLPIHILNLLYLSFVSLKSLREIRQFVLMLCCCIYNVIQFVPYSWLNCIYFCHLWVGPFTELASVGFGSWGISFILRLWNQVPWSSLWLLLNV